MQNYYYPFASGSSPSTGINGSTAPTESTQVAGQSSDGKLRPISTDISGNVNVNSTIQGTPAVNITEVAGAAPSASNPLAARISNGIAFVDPTQIRALTSADVVSAAQSGTWNITNVSGTVSLPTGAATSANQSTANTALSSIQTNTGNIPAKGQTTMVGSMPVAIASDQSTLPVSAASLPLPSGAATSANQSTANTSLSTIATNTGNIPAKGQAAMSASMPVAIASDQSAVPTSETTSGTSTVTSVASSATNVTLLAANAARKNATFYNNSTQILYLKLGLTASTSSFTVAIVSNGYYELPTGKIYTGEVDGIWASANGACLVTELT